MADYYPLLAKAVAGLPNSTPDARRSIYERARKALFGQLRSLDPPVPEAVIEREARALEEAVARLEVELSLQASEISTPVPTVPVPAPEPAVVVPAPPPPEAARISRNIVGPTTPSPAVPGLQTRAQDRRSAPPEISGRGVPAEPEAAHDTATVGLGKEQSSAEEARPPATAAVVEPRKEVRRPSVPLPAQKARVPQRRWIVGAVVGTIIVVAALAYALRDRPEDVVRAPAASQPTTTDQTAGGKIADRIGSGETNLVEPEPATPLVKREDAPRPTQAQPETPPAVARRAALLVEAPEEQAKVKIWLGTVLWRVENINNGPGEPLGTAVRAEIDIPEEKLQAVMTFQKNTDGTLPASHVMKLRFVIQPGGPMGNVNRINAPYLRREDAPTGDPLNGVPVPIMENSFLVGLSKGPAEATNLDLLRTREWLDVPMVFANGKIAKLTFEKGTSGQRAIEDALAVWQAQ